MSSDASTTGEPTAEPEPAPDQGTQPRKPRFTLPSAYTILFGLIVLTALATWIIPAGRYELDPEGSPITGTYHEVDSTPSRIVVDSLRAPINGLYGIEEPATGNVDVFNSGELFGAIDVALFILVIGGFIAITMKAGAIQAGIALLVRRLGGHERWMIPSSSGLATVAMPIMAPLADFAGADRSLVVTAYQSASGLLNPVTPTSAIVMGGLAIARVPYGKYLRFVWPLLVVLGVLTVVVLALGAQLP